MKTKNIITLGLVLLLVSLFGASGCSSKYGEPVSGNVGNNITVGLAVQPSTPRVGDNGFRVTLQMATAPIENANVQVSYLMPAMGTMQAMQGSNSAKPTGKKGEYETSLNLPMEGSWIISVTAKVPGQSPIQAEYHLRTGSSSITFAGE
jgi:YtkA-like protein